MSDTSDFDIPVTMPDPTYVRLAAAFIRGLFQIASGLGFGYGAFVSGDQLTMIATALVMVATFVWSFWQKIQSVRHRRQAVMMSATQSASASAAAGRPIAVMVTNPTTGATADAQR